METNLAKAKKNYDENPKDEMNIIWYGRRMAYLSHYQKAVDIYTNGLTISPESYKLLRHRGHRYISMRKFDLVHQGYGVGNWYLVAGDTVQAMKIFEEIIKGKHWPAFGFIAAEAEIVSK